MTDDSGYVVGTGELDGLLTYEEWLEEEFGEIRDEYSPSYFEG